MTKTIGKKAEDKIKEWLDRPQDGYSFDRIPDQMSGLYIVSRNICDFVCYKYPNIYYIESKETEKDRFDFSQLSDRQRNGLYLKSTIDGVYGLVILLFTTYQRAFVLNIKDIAEINPDISSFDIDDPKSTILKIKSLNITKIDKWTIPYKEIQTIPSRKNLLDYTGELEVPQ